MFRKQDIAGRRGAAALFIAAMLFFALGIVPEHAAAHTSHATCKICTLLHHPPMLQTGALLPIRPALRKEFLPPAASHPALLEPRMDPGLSRAPPTPV